MVIESILAQLDQEIAKLKQARALLAGTGKVAAKLAAHKDGKAKTHRKHVLSAEARKRIADAQRKRWAAQRSKAKKEA